MRGMTHRWRLIEGIREGGAPPLVERVLAARGLSGESALSFCDPRLTQLHDPSLLPGLERAAERIIRALRAGERIVIYGDYDVDGVTAASILHRVANELAPGAPIEIYIPHRIEEGYGLNAEALRELASRGADVVVTVDCGVTAHAEARDARELGVDLIITDHHNASGGTAGEMPGAYALVHPRAAGSEYPFGELCGAGVAFKLAWRLATMWTGSERVHPKLRDLLLDCLALAGLGTIADVVPLVDENRVIARFGLSRLRSTNIVGLNALIDASNLSGEKISAEHVGFVLGPRLNACGRMGHARQAAELLTTATGERANEIAEHLARVNTERQGACKKTFEHAKSLAEEAGMTQSDHRAIVLAHEDWHPGIVGIVCSRLVDRFGRPAILMQRKDGVCKGSCRSVEDFNIHAALTGCEAQLSRFGGHDMAAGLELAADQLDAFTHKFVRIANGAITVEQLTPSLRVDCAATLDEFSIDTVTRLENLAPFGRANPKPAVLLEDLRLTRDAAPLGARGKHLCLQVTQGSRSLRIVGWSKGEWREQLRAGMRIDAVVRPKVNRWNGRVSVESELLDLREVKTPDLHTEAGISPSRPLTSPSSSPS